MTVQECLDLARELSRTSSSGVSEVKALKRLNLAQEAFAKEVNCLVKEAYLTLSPKFDIYTHFAIRLTITGGTDALVATDIAICSTDAKDQTGTQVATALQTAIQAAGASNTTVTWSTTTWKFTITAPTDTTSITIAEPSGITYASALDLLGLSAETTTGYTICDNIPEDCTVEVDLPSDFLEILPSPEWNGDPLFPAPRNLFTSPETWGTPSHYAIEGRKMRLFPSPEEQKTLYIRYKYLPAAFSVISGYQDCGLSSKTLATATGLADTTKYYFKVTADGGEPVEYDITTATDTSYKGVIALLNTETSGVCTWSLVGGDLRCTSDDTTADSSIALAAGTTGTDLFATLTGFTAFDTAVASELGDDLNVDSEWGLCIAFYVAYLMALGNFEQQIAQNMYANFMKEISKHKIQHANNNPKIFPRQNPVIIPEVNIES